MENTYIRHHLYQGPDNISIQRLTCTDLIEIYHALNIAQNYAPTEECITLMEKIKCFLKRNNELTENAEKELSKRK